MHAVHVCGAKDRLAGLCPFHLVGLGIQLRLSGLVVSLSADPSPQTLPADVWLGPDAQRDFLQEQIVTNPS